MHAELRINEKCNFFFSDIFGYVRPNGITTLILESEEEIDRLFAALSVGGKVQMPLEVQFWGAKFGEVTDQYGLSWSLNYEMPK